MGEVRINQQEINAVKGSRSWAKRGCAARQARLPTQYGYYGWPKETAFFPTAPLHNFYFTSEVQAWFRYEAATDARLDFTGDDDVWVFINGRLAVDLGGIHVPMDGSVAATGRDSSGARCFAAPLLGTLRADPFGTAASCESRRDVGQKERTLRDAACRASGSTVRP